MKLSIVIPAHNEEGYISNCLDSLNRYIVGDPKLLEIIVVDNASTDKTAEIANKFSGVRVVSEPRKGANYARQKGLEEAKGELIAYLDADTEISADWLYKIYEHFQGPKELICLSGPAYFFDLSDWHNIAMETYYNLVAKPTHTATGYMVIGSNFVVKKDALEQIGGFDTNIPFYGDDANIGRRLSRAGRVEFDKKFMVYTSGRRMAAEGVVKVSMRYAANYISETVIRKPISKRYNDIR
ncbi:glycosyltransferase family 2 protein [Patescibacteria group bacterium]|nr:glycosyltransferase family 2 protein [Patescibacteria group bacterium]